MGSSYTPPAQVPTLDQVLQKSGITPVVDGEKVSGLGIGDDGKFTTQLGIIVASQDATGGTP